MRRKRILEVFGRWKAPEKFQDRVFVIRVGEVGRAHVDGMRDDPLAIHKFLLDASVICVFRCTPGNKRLRRAVAG